MEMLTHESMYRGTATIERRKNISIAICGAGALGSWIAEFLIRQGYVTLNIIDFDKVERSNIGTQNYGLIDVGKLKAKQLSNNIYQKTNIMIKYDTRKLTTSNISGMLKGYDLIIDLFDNIESRSTTSMAAKKFNIPCLHAGLATIGFSEICWDEEYRLPDHNPHENGPCEYPMALNLILLTCGLVCETVCLFVDKNIKRNADFWIDKLVLTTKEIKNDQSTKNGK